MYLLPVVYNKSMIDSAIQRYIITFVFSIIGVHFFNRKNGVQIGFATSLEPPVNTEAWAFAWASPFKAIVKNFQGKTYPPIPHFSFYQLFTFASLHGVRVQSRRCIGLQRLFYSLKN